MVNLDFNEVKSMVEEFFNGQYEVKKFLGAGSFAEVYLVKHNFLDDLRAMKIIKEPLKSGFQNKEIFHEVMVATQLRHENIISIYDAGIISSKHLEDNMAYFVMEYVPGGDLEQYLNSFIDSNLFMPVNRALDLIKQILQGLNTLHMSNPPIVHRDLKLNNILLSYSSKGDIILKLSDFGIAKEVTTTISDVDIAGTRPYMAPEAFNKDISTMTDIYAIGVIFYQLLTNHLPYDIDEFAIDDFLDLKPWKFPLKPPSYYNRNVSRDLDEIVMRCLKANPDERFHDAAELLANVEISIEKLDESINPEEFAYGGDYSDEYFEAVVTEQIKSAFELSKCEGRLNEAIEILEVEVLSDYNIRKCYGETLRMWKSKNPDLKLISKAFTVNLRGKNYKLACSLLAEAIAYNPTIRNKYEAYIDLWNIFIDLANDSNLIKAIISLENLMDANRDIHEIYVNIISTLKTYSIEEIVNEAIRLVNLNNLVDASNLMEFAVVCDSKISDEYSYRLSLWKQNMNPDFKRSANPKSATVDYAIDLGTTDSIISYFNKGEPIIIKNHLTGEDYTPSAVLIDENNSIQVGDNARDAVVFDFNNAVTEFKHNMGFSVPFKFEKTSRILYPEELSAEVLKDLRVSVFNQCGVDIDSAVICVPSNSNPIKTRAVNNACELAGFRSHSLILEPIAVGIAYDLNKSDGIYMIYDLGGGTFNVSLIKSDNGEMELLATKGLDNMGGNVFDWRIIDEIFAPKIKNDLHLDNFKKNNPKYFNAFSKLKCDAEVAKKELSDSLSTDICVNNLFENYDFTYTLTREKLKEIMEPLINITFNLCYDMLNEKELAGGEIDEIILVGGSCLSPLVKQFVREEFDMPVEDGINPLTVVSQGAAIYAGSLEKPLHGINQNTFSIIINSQYGRIFAMDSTFLFLGFCIEFVFDDGSSRKTQVNPDGTFKTLANPQDDYDIRVFNQKGPVEIEMKFASSTDRTSYGQLNDRYGNLLKRADYLRDYNYSLDAKLLNFTERLMERSRIDDIAVSPCISYLNKLEDILDDYENDLEFSVLLENVENKIRIAEENEWFDISDLDLDEAIKDKDLDKLKGIYSRLIENYVILNRNDVIEACFFNLRLDGIYTDNQDYANELIGKSIDAINNSNYDELFSYVNKLYELDERNLKGVEHER